MSADHAFETSVARFEDRWSHVVVAINRPLAAIRPEEHGPIVGGFGHHGNGPGDPLTTVVQMRQQLDDGPLT